MATLIDQDFFARLRALNDKFAAGVPATLARLQAAARGVRSAARRTPQLVAELHQILHTIAGSAATFGFRTMGQQARALEQRLRVLMAFEQCRRARLGKLARQPGRLHGVGRARSEVGRLSRRSAQE